MKIFCSILLVIVVQVIWGQTSTAPSAGDGSVTTPYQIASLENLYWIAENSSRWGAAYEQTADIDASETSSWFSGAGWLPIGNGSTKFTGSYDGQGYEVSGLYIDRTAATYVGLFGYTHQAAISNLGVTNVSITGSNLTGALIGYKTYGNVSSCHSSGVITVTLDYAPTGGLIGQNGRPTTSFSSSVSNCYSTVSVTGKRYTGGLVGQNQHLISNSYSTGTVTGVTMTGGCVGYQDAGEIRDCYSRGNVSGTYEAGGFIGGLYYGGLYNCYSTGIVTGTSSVGGLIGFNNSGNGTATACVWDKESSGRITSPGGTGKTTAEMKNLSTFVNAGWDLEDETANGPNNYWDLDLSGTDNNGYPFLSWQNGAVVSLPVELSSFTAMATNGAVLIRWTTATEINNHGFEVERREVRGSGFELGEQNVNPKPQTTNQEWLRAGFVEGNGTSTVAHEYVYTDRDIPAGKYSYRLKQIDRDGSFAFSQAVEVIISHVPKQFVLLQNFPNPFNPATTIGFTLPVSGFTTLIVHDALGREVTALVNGVKEAGSHSVPFTAPALNSGIYFYTLKSGGFSASRKLLFVK